MGHFSLKLLIISSIKVLILCLGFHLSSFLALDALPLSESTSDGLKYFLSISIMDLLLKKAFSFNLVPFQVSCILSFFADKLELHTPSKSSQRHHRFIYTELEKMLFDYQPNDLKKTAVAKNLHVIAENIARRS